MADQGNELETFWSIDNDVTPESSVQTSVN